MTSTLPTNQSNKNRTALIMAGGTGGHIFPGLAVAKELVAKGWHVHWLGSKGGMEQDLVSKQNIAISLIAVSGLRGNGLLGWIKAPYSLLRAMIEASTIIRQVSPQVVLGFGGFASGPGGLAAKLLGKYLVIHEQNAIAGMTNKMLAKFANRVFQAFPNTFDSKVKAETIGNPIRQEITRLATPEVDEKVSEANTENSLAPIKVLVIGGSRGAQALNQRLPHIFTELLQAGKIQVRHQCGEAGYQLTFDSYKKVGVNESETVKIEKFIDDMAAAYQWADVVVCRAGALTVSEIAAVGIAAIFIPFPFAVDDHQTLNAKWLAEQQAGIIIPQAMLSSEESKQAIQALLGDSNRIIEMARRAKEIAYFEAADIMAQACEDKVEMAA